MEDRGVKQRDMLIEAGFDTPDGVAEGLGIGKGYAKDLIRGTKPISKPLKDKLNALAASMAAKANGPEPVESKHVLEHGEIRERVEQFEVDLQAPQPMPRRTKYQVIKVFDGYAVVENPIAVFRGLSWAEEYAHWLNDQINRGKGGG